MIFWSIKSRKILKKIHLTLNFPKLLTVSGDFRNILILFRNGHVQIYNSNLMVKIFESTEEDNELLTQENHQSIVCNFDCSTFVGIEVLDQNRIRVFRFDSKKIKPMEKISNSEYDFSKKSLIKMDIPDIQSIKICQENLLHIEYINKLEGLIAINNNCLLYTSPSPRDLSTSRMPSSA